MVEKLRSTVSVFFAMSATLAFAQPSSLSGELAYYENPRTLFGVAKRFHLSVDDIAKLNGIKDPNHFNAYGLVLPDTPSTRALPRYVAWIPSSLRQTCAVTGWDLVRTKKRGHADAYCGNGPEGEEACLFRDHQGGILEIASPKGPPAQMRVELADFNPYGASLVDVASVDLDGDGMHETLVSWLTGVGNGIAEEWRTLVVLKEGREFLRYDSGEFTAKSAAVLVNGRCHLASSHYEEVTHPLRGPALYLVERTFNPLEMQMDEELVGRRVSDSTRFVIPFDPLVTSAAGLGLKGKIAQVHCDMSGNLKAVSFRSSTSLQQLEDEPYDTLRFGDTRTRRIFPFDLVRNDLAGQAAKLERQASNPTRLFWLGE